MRNSSNPAENENNKRKDPPIIFSPVSENPAHISPYGPHIANTAKPQPASKTKRERAFVGSLWIKNAYKILPIFHKIKTSSDHSEGTFP